MVRYYANMSTAIWHPDDDFADLTMSGQWLYMMLGTQSDISAVGLLPLSAKRWARRCRGGTVEMVLDALKEADTAGKVVCDWESEEVLIRTFVKADGGYGNPRRRPSILRAAGQVESLRLRRALAVEFTKLGLPLDNLRLPDSSGTDSLSGPYAPKTSEQADQAAGNAPNTPGSKSPKTASSQVNRLSDRQSPSEGVVVTVRTEEPQPSTRKPQPPPPPALSATHHRANAARPEEEGFGPEWIDRLTRRVLGERSDWLEDEVRQALANPKLRERSPDVVERVFVQLAKDLSTERPGRLNARHGLWAAAHREHQEARRAAEVAAKGQVKPHDWVSGAAGVGTCCNLPQRNPVHHQRPAGATSAMRSVATRREAR